MGDDKKDTGERYEVRLVCIDEGGKESVIETRELPKDKLEAQAVSQLPDREAMSLVNANLFAPINLSAALNVLSDSSVAVSNAQQYVPTNQTI